MKETASILYNLATPEAELGLDLDALAHFRAFLEIAPLNPHVNDAVTTTANRKVEELLKRVGQIEVEAPNDARIFIDTRSLDDVPSTPVAVSPGRHVVKGTLRGSTVSTVVTPKAGETVKAKLSFSDAGVAGGPFVASPPEPTHSERTTLGWALPIGLGVVGVAGVVTGAVFASSSRDAKDELDRQRAASPGLCAVRNAACAAYQEQVDTVNSRGTLAWVGYGVGGLALAGAVVTFLIFPKRETPTRGATLPGARAMLVPILGSQVGGATLNMRF